MQLRHLDADGGTEEYRVPETQEQSKEAPEQQEEGPAQPSEPVQQENVAPRTQHGTAPVAAQEQNEEVPEQHSRGPAQPSEPMRQEADSKLAKAMSVTPRASTEDIPDVPPPMPNVPPPE